MLFVMLFVKRGHIPLLTVHTLASGSEGNCLLLSGGGVHLLVDAGISARRITASLRELGLSPRDVTAVLLTHEHTDHTAGLATLTKQYRLPLYASDDTAAALALRCPALRDVLHPIPRQYVFSLGDVDITVFPTSHDAAGGVDYRFDCLGASVGVLTDTGCVTSEAEAALRGVRLLVLESNHDADWLMSGPYPYYLKQRIAGRLGHLSNDDAAAFAHRLAEQGTCRFVLAHQSRENNTPARALQVMETALTGLHAVVEVAPRGELSTCYEAEVTLCSV